MPSFADRMKQLASEELPEAPITGPFGGVQSELAPTQIETLGFLNTDNMIFRLGRAALRPGFTDLGTLGEPILGSANFFDSVGDEHQVVMTPTKLYKFASGAFTEITGAGFTGSATQRFAWDVLNYKLCFSQGADKIWSWDGLAAGYVQTSVSAPAARYMAEIGLHLVAVDGSYPQRYIWSAAGDPTDWTSLTSGLNDNVSNLGPINGLMKIGQYGFGFHQKGILQIVPTGVGLSPFNFFPIINTRQSVAAPYSLQRYDDQGMEFAVFLGVDNVYIFNGTSIMPIGDSPLDGRRRIGARTQILQDVLTAGLANCYGAISYTISGNAFRAYWLLVPPNRIWVYNFDEGNWTRFTYGSKINTVAPFVKQTVIRIMDLVGTIQDQSWSPATLNPNNPFLGFLLGFDSGVPGYVDMTNLSEVAGNVTSGQIMFGDRRHKHTIKKFRIAFVDRGSATYSLTISNEQGISQTRSFTLGSGSGQELSYVLPFSITGLRFIWTLNVAAETPGELVEFAPIYDVAGEQRGGILEN